MTKIVLAMMAGTFVAAFALEFAELRTQRLRQRFGRAVRELRRDFWLGYSAETK